MQGLIAVRRRHQEPVGMGNWGAAVTGLIAEGELNQLMSAVRGLADKLISAIGIRNELLNGYKEARALEASTLKLARSPIIQTPVGAFPNPAMIPATVAVATAVKGVRVMAREVQTLGFLDRIFTEISAALTKAGLSNDANAVDITLSQVRRFNVETDNLFSIAPEYMAAKREILSAAQVEWKGWGVSENAYGDPRWFAAYLKAADRVVPVEGKPTPPSQLREQGLAGLPVLAAMLVWVIGIVVAGMALSSAISRILPDTNLKARKTAELLEKYQAQKAEETLQMRAAGRSEAEISARMAAIDAEAERAVKNIPDPPSFLKPILIMLGVVAGGFAVGKLTGVI